MIRDGAKDVSLRYLAEQPRYFSTSHIASGIFFLILVSKRSILTLVKQL